MWLHLWLHRFQSPVVYAMVVVVVVVVFVAHVLLLLLLCLLCQLDVFVVSFVVLVL